MMHPLIVELADRDCANGYPKTCAEIALRFLGLPRKWCLPCRAKVEVQRNTHDLGRIEIAQPTPETAPVPVILESPYAGDIARNVRYLNACIRDSISLGEAPFASHRMYTGALIDEVPAERAAGITAGFAWRELTSYTVVYKNLGISKGMRAGIEHAESMGQAVVFRSLAGWKA